MNKGSEARAAESFRGRQWGKKPDAMFQELLVRLTDTWTEELFGNMTGAAAPDQLLEVVRFTKNEGEKCKACQEGNNTDKAKRCFEVDMKDQPGTRWIFCLARRDLTEAFQSLVALELQEQWLEVAFLEDFAPASQAAKEGQIKRERKQRSWEHKAKNKWEETSLIGQENPGQRSETEATNGGNAVTTQLHSAAACRAHCLDFFGYQNPLNSLVLRPFSSHPILVIEFEFFGMVEAPSS